MADAAGAGGGGGASSGATNAAATGTGGAGAGHSNATGSVPSSKQLHTPHCVMLTGQSARSSSLAFVGPQAQAGTRRATSTNGARSYRRAQARATRFIASLGGDHAAVVLLGTVGRPDQRVIVHSANVGVHLLADDQAVAQAVGQAISPALDAVDQAAAEGVFAPAAGTAGVVGLRRPGTQRLCRFLRLQPTTNLTARGPTMKLTDRRV